VADRELEIRPGPSVLIIEHRGIGDINTMWAQLGVDPPTTG